MPHFSGVNANRYASYEWVTEHQGELVEKRVAAAQQMFDKHAAEQSAKAGDRPARKCEPGPAASEQGSLVAGARPRAIAFARAPRRQYGPGPLESGIHDEGLADDRHDAGTGRGRVRRGGYPRGSEPSTSTPFAVEEPGAVFLDVAAVGRVP